MEKLVSCHIITYNQKNYISQCIDGALMQKTTFDYEIVIGDDCSTDGTKDILLEYAIQYPNKIKLNLREKRGDGILGKENFTTTLQLCNGKYISLCDGDDYWIDPFKLQKQVDFLEENKDFAICAHEVKIISEEISVEDKVTDTKIEIAGIEDLANGMSIYTASCVFRNNLIKLPDWYIDSPAGDYVLHMLNAQYGKIKIFKDVMAVYRLHTSSLWEAKDELWRYVNWIKVLDLLIGCFDENINTILSERQLAVIDEMYSKKLPGAELAVRIDYIPKSFDILLKQNRSLKYNNQEINRKLALIENSKVYKYIAKPITALFGYFK